MGLIESREIKSAVSSDGLQNVKKVAFIHSSVQFLEMQKERIKQEWQTLVEEKLYNKIQSIQNKKQLCGQLFNDKVNQIELKDPDFIDKLQAKMRKSFKEISGYKRAVQNLQTEKKKTFKSWNQQTAKIFKQMDLQTQKIIEKMMKEIPETPALNKLAPQTKQKALLRYIEDESYEIQRDEYNRRAFEQLDKAFPFEQLLDKRLNSSNPNVEVEKIVTSFMKNMEGNSIYSAGCGFRC